MLVIYQAAAAPGWASSLPAGEWSERRVDADAPSPVLDQVLRNSPPSAAVIDGALPHALARARQIASRAPQAQLAFVCEGATEGAFRQSLGADPLHTANWTVLDPDAPAFAARLAEQVERGEDRTREMLDAGSRPPFETTTQPGASVDRYLAAVVDHSSEPIVMITPATTVVSWNASAVRLWGWRASDAIGHDFADFLQPASRSTFDECLDRARATRAPVRREFAALGTEFDAVALELTIVPVFDDAGTLSACFVMARAISEVERDRENLERIVAERTALLHETIAQLEQFSYTISHDLRAPVRAIRGYADILHEELSATSPPGAAEYITRIIRASDRMDALIRDVLSYSRVATASLEKEPVNTNTIVNDILAELPDPVRRSAAIIVDAPLPCVTAHTGLLSQSLGNLVGNAIKFTRPGERPHVHIYSERRGDRVRIHVADRGIGIPPEFRAKIFGVFERSPTAKRYQGTGIGLAIVKKSIERLGGSVGYKSVPGEGSTFWIELPEAPAT